jgi:hypothetical protein
MGTYIEEYLDRRSAELGEFVIDDRRTCSWCGCEFGVVQARRVRHCFTECADYSRSERASKSRNIS